MTKLKEFDLTKLNFLKPKRSNSMYISKVLYNGNDINIQLKRKIAVSNIYRDGNKYYLDLVFDSENEKDENFIKLYKQLEMTSIKKIYNKYNEWMNTENKLEWEDVYSSFKTNLSVENDIKKIKFSLLTDGKIMNTMFYNELLEKVSYKEIEEGDELSLIVYFNGIKFGKQNFENQWEILQVKKYNEEDKKEEKKDIIDECQIIVDSDDETDLYDEDSIDLEEVEKLENMIEEKYKKYNEEEGLKLIS